MPDSIEMLQIKNDKLEEELDDFITNRVEDKVVNKHVVVELRKHIQMYSNIAYALGYEEGKNA